MGDFGADVRAGLSKSPKHLPCVWFYDARGSQLFEEICATDEYYLTRAEREILETHATAIAARFSAGATICELGSGSAAKTRLLLSALLARDGAARYVPIDISSAALDDSARALRAEYPTLEIAPVLGDYHDDPGLVPAGPRVLLWLGSNVGNFDRARAAAFLRKVGGPMLMGVDLRKDRRVLEAAYDDARGVTARFNLNLLLRINRELGGHFDLGHFRHRAVYDTVAGRIEMYLVSAVTQRVRIDRLGLEVDFAAGEAMHTESSYKYSPEEIDALARAAGLQVVERWLDRAGRFSLNLMT